jgi:cytochrome c-type biogenesis protein CcmH
MSVWTSRPRGSVRLALGVAALGLAIAAGVLAWGISGPDAGTESASLPITREALTAHLARTPRDGRAWVLLARIEFENDRFPEAAAAFERALDASRKVVLDAGIWCEYADALGMAQGGSLEGRPRELIERALALNSAHPRALEMAGSAAYARGDFASAARHWKQLLVQLAEGTPAYGELAAAVTRAERKAAARMPLTDRAG